MAHLGARAFEDIGGEVVQTTSFILENVHVRDYQSSYKRLVDYNSQDEKENEYLSEKNLYVSSSENFSKIPGSPVAYWVSKAFINIFDKSIPLEKIAYSFQGIITGDNNYFLRLWSEVSNTKVVLNLSNDKKYSVDNVWIPYNKGGEFRKWYGNNGYLLRWANRGQTLTRARTENIDWYFKPCVTWSFVTSGNFSCRYMKDGSLWDVAGSSIFQNGNIPLKYICALMNSKVAQLFFDVTNPTINYQVMNIIALPFINSQNINLMLVYL